MTDGLIQPGSIRSTKRCAPNAVRLVLISDCPREPLSFTANDETSSLSIERADSVERVAELAIDGDVAGVILDSRTSSDSLVTAARRIRWHASLQHTPILFVVAADDPLRWADEAYELGAVDFLAEPIQPAILLAKIAHWNRSTATSAERNRNDERRAARMAVNQILANTDTIAEAAPQVLEAIGGNLGWDVGAFWHVRAEGDRLVCLDVWARSPESVPRFLKVSRERSFAPGEGLPGRIWGSGRPHWIPDVLQDDNFPRAPIAAQEGLHAAIGFPITIGKETLGVIEFFSHEIREPDADKLEMAATIGGQIGQFMQRRRAETMVRDATHQLQLVTESMSALVTCCSRDFRYLWVSKPYARWVKRDADELRGMPIVSVLGEAAMVRLMPHFEKVLQGNQIQYEEEVDLGPLGVRWVNATYTPTMDSLGVPDGWVAVVVDVTQRRETEDALRQSERRFARFMDQLPGLAWIKDLDGRYVYVNSTARKTFGRSGEPVLGKTDDDLFPEETAKQFKENDRRALASEVGLQTIESLLHDDGTVHYSLVHKFPFRGPKDSHVLVGGIAVDITDRLRAEELLRKEDRRKSDFLATLAHELRNPLAPLRTGLEVLKISRGDPATVEKTRVVMERQLGHMVRLVDDLLDISRITKGRLQLRRERVELFAIVRDAIEANRALIDSLNHELITELPPFGLVVDVDATRMTQVISNLLNNAAKYTPTGGTIELIVKERPSEIEIVVRDSGIGIEPDNLRFVFEPFSQLVPSLERAQGGLGVGLGLVRAFVELHEGRVEARSAGAGKGSEFVVTLPHHDWAAETPTARAPSRPKETVPGDRRILIVDDNRDAANSLAILLQVAGYETKSVYDSLEAIQAFETFRPDVILLDIGMPRMNGFELVRRLRQHAGARSVTIIAVTGWGQEADRRRSIEAGFDYHLTKPIDLATVQDVLRRVRNE